MRGRTNVVQRSGTVPVNGVIRECEVEEGNTINAGDFVSYVEDSELITVSTQQLQTSYIPLQNIGDYYFRLNDENDYLYIFKKKDNCFILFSIYSNYTISSFFVYESFVYCLVNVGDNYKVVKLKFDNEQLMFDSEVTLSYANRYNASICKFKDKVLVVDCTFSSLSPSSGGYFRFEYFNLSDLGSTGTIQGSSKYLGSIYGMFELNENLVIINSSLKTYNGGTYYYYVDFYNIDFEQKTVTNIINYDMSNSGGISNIWRLVSFDLFNNLNLMFISGTKDSKISLINVDDKTKDILNLTGWYNVKTVSAISNLIDRKFIVAGYDGNESKDFLCVLEYNESTNEIEEFSDIFYFNITGVAIVCLWGGSFISLFTSNSDGVYNENFLLSNDFKTISSKVLKDKVKEYSGSGIGFAKTSGTSGDVIQIYTPE